MSDIPGRHIKSIVKYTRIPENICRFIASIDRCNIILGIGNTDEKDLNRIKDMMSDGLFSTLHLITISNNVNYNYAESLSGDVPQHIAINFDFCDAMSWFKLQKILTGKVNIFTFDMSTTKFVNWGYDRFMMPVLNVFTNIRSLIQESGIIYYPVEPTKAVMPAQSSCIDEISIIDKLSGINWVSKKFLINKKSVNVHRIKYIFTTLHSQIIKHFKSARTGITDKVFILTNNRDDQYVRSIVDSIFEGKLTVDNSIIMFCDTNHKKIHDETNIYFYYDTPDMIYDTYEVFKMSNAFNNVGIVADGPVTNDAYPTITKGWVVASNNSDIFKKSGAVCIEELHKVLPEYSYISTLVSENAL